MEKNNLIPYTFTSSECSFQLYPAHEMQRIATKLINKFGFNYTSPTNRLYLKIQNGSYILEIAINGNSANVAWLIETVGFEAFPSFAFWISKQKIWYPISPCPERWRKVGNHQERDVHFATVNEKGGLEMFIEEQSLVLAKDTDEEARKLLDEGWLEKAHVVKNPRDKDKK